MDFNDKLPVRGQLEIIKKIAATGEEEVLFDNHNVICSGLGQTITAIMSTSGCYEEECASETTATRARSVFSQTGAGMLNRGSNQAGDATSDSSDPKVDKCPPLPYQIDHFQVGIGASGITAASTLNLIGRPLTEEEYGEQPSVKINEYTIYANEDTPLLDQAVGDLYGKDSVSGYSADVHGGNLSGIINLVVLDEQTANGQTLNEIGLFVHNPFIKTVTYTTTESKTVSPRLLGQRREEVVETEITEETPGCLLAAYQQYGDIKKDSYFSLLFRWTIYFSDNTS
tara:strand:- start:40794 stop:41648 length:855 start_codon:yes stop_codon:yes gene_type:complete